MFIVHGISKAVRVVLLFGLLALLCFGVPRSALAGSAVPHFALPSVADGAVIDSDQFKGRVRLITFWATWCPPCREEVPSLIRLQNEFGSKGFTVVALSVDQGGVGVVRKFVEKNKVNYPVVRADRDVLQKFGGVSGVPYSFLVDKGGKVVKSYPGYADYRILRTDISGLID
jgi:thiol-disulfide isomerase/thioredoxin